MSYPGSPPATGAGPASPPATEIGPRRRPVAVTAAAALLSVMAAIGLAHALAGLVTLGGTVERFRAATASTAADQTQLTTALALIRGGAALATVVAVGVAVLLVLLALGLYRGNRGAQLATWAVCALGLLLGCGALAVTGLQRVVPLHFGPGDLASEQLVRAAAGAYPPWWAALGASLAAGQALGYLAVATLLAMPAATGFFRRPGGDGALPAAPAGDRLPVPAAVGGGTPSATVGSGTPSATVGDATGRG